MISRTTRNSKGHKRWLPCRAWDFKSLMYPCAFCAKLFGFFPYKYKNEEYVLSKTGLLFATFAACFHLAFQTYVLYCVNFSNPNDSIQETMAENFFALLEGSIPFLTFLTFYSRLFVFQRVSEVSRILSPQDFNHMAKFLHTTHILNIVFNLIYVPIYYVNKENIPLVRRYVNLIIVIASNEAVLFYLICVCVLGECCKKVNECLKRLKEPPTNCESQLTEKQYPHRQDSMLLMKVKYYEDVHEKISDAVEQLNKSSLSNNIVLTMSTFVLVTFDLYSYMQAILNASGLLTDVYLQFEYFSYVVLRFAKFALLIWVCETMTGHATEINTTIYDLANNCTDVTVKRELMYFALQVVHRDNAFTARAFKINGKLLSQVLSGVFMYLMILFQFLMNTSCAN